MKTTKERDTIIAILRGFFFTTSQIAAVLRVSGSTVAKVKMRRTPAGQTKPRQRRVCWQKAFKRYAELAIQPTRILSGEANSLRDALYACLKLCNYRTALNGMVVLADDFIRLPLSACYEDLVTKVMCCQKGKVWSEGYWQQLLEDVATGQMEPPTENNFLLIMASMVASKTRASLSLPLGEDDCRLIDQLLASLNEREERILRLRFGFEGPPVSLEGVALLFGVTRERIRQIEIKALNRLRHPSRRNKLNVLCSTTGELWEKVRSDLLQEPPVKETTTTAKLSRTEISDHRSSWPLDKRLKISIDELELTVRVYNALDAHEIRKVGDLQGKTRNQILKLKGFGHKSCREIQGTLSGIGLELTDEGVLQEKRVMARDTNTK